MSIPLYLVASVLMAGLYLNRNGKQERMLEHPRETIPEDEKPSAKNSYHSEKYYDVFNKEFNEAGKAFLKAQDPINDNVLPRFWNEMQTNQEYSPEIKSYIEKRGSRLKQYNEQVKGKETFINEGGKEQSIQNSPMFNPLGKDLPPTMLTESEQQDQIEHFKIGNRRSGANNSTKEEHFGMFTIHGPRNSNNPGYHNNMVPFFGSHIYQNTDPVANQSLLERFTGQTNSSTELRANPKREIPSLQDRTPGQTFVYGSPSENVDLRDRYVSSTLKTNVTPIEQVRVGPGITPGHYDWAPRDGFHPWYRPPDRNVDELRVNPKNTYEGRLNPGEEIVKSRGVIGETFHYNPDRFFINDPRRWLKTTGAFTGPAIRENFNMYKQNREDTNIAYVGSAGNQEIQAPRPGVYIEGSVESQAVDGNRGSNFPLAPIAWINSQVRHTDNNQLPSFIPYTDMKGDSLRTQKTPYDSARTTTKETTFVENYVGTVGTNDTQREQKYLYDEARPTIKQTTYVEGYTGQVANEGGVQRTQKYLYDQARPTTKQTTYIEGYNGQVGTSDTQREQKYLYDEARPTTKQTTYIENYTGQVANEGGVQRTQKYLYDEARPTTKQTTYVQNYTGQVANEGGVQRTQKYQYDKARPTTRQTTYVQNYTGQVANEGGVQRTQKYQYDDARPTTKQTTYIQNYTGQAGTESTTKPEKYYYDEARPTTRQTTLIENYSGIIGGGPDNSLPVSYESMYNATNKNTQEILLQGRAYGPNKATNVTVGACDVNMQIRQRANYDITKWGQNENRLYTAIPNVGDSYQNTDTHNQRDLPGIRQPEEYVVSQFERNPYSQSLTSAPQVTTPFARAEVAFNNYPQ